MTKEIVKTICDLSNFLKMSDGELLDVCLENLDLESLRRVHTHLKYHKIIQKLKEVFSSDADVQKTREPDEFFVNGILYEVVSKKVAIENELDFMNDDEEKINWLKEVALNDEEIGAYKRYADDLYAREM